ncbi:MAG TPA: DUF2970 domain-containing protein [Usitatibacteraceae bacterium]|jgi:hypothetical protein|nr:DUF2970 domain-containing protein [Usitatibacteraceae bacterium]
MFKALLAVLWAFLGIRSSKGYEADRRRLKPWEVIAAGLFCTVVFVLGLIVLVRILTAK